MTDDCGSKHPWLIRSFARLALLSLFSLCYFILQVTKGSDFTRMLQIEEEFVKQLCDDIIAAKPDLIFTEKGVSGTSF